MVPDWAKVKEWALREIKTREAELASFNSSREADLISKGQLDVARRLLELASGKEGASL